MGRTQGSGKGKELHASERQTDAQRNKNARKRVRDGGGGSSSRHPAPKKNARPDGGVSAISTPRAGHSAAEQLMSATMAGYGTVQLMIAGMTSIMTELGSGGVTCTGCPRNAQRLF